MANKYFLEIDNKRIGFTEFEYADVPMGVVHGKIIFDEIDSPYVFFRNHCLKYNIKINLDDPSEFFIDSQIIPRLKVYLESGIELLGWGGAIVGMDSEEYEIQFGGVSSELMKTEFSHHYLNYFGDQ